MALVDQSGNENCFSVNSNFIILANSTLIRKHFRVLISAIVKSKQLTTNLCIGVLKGRDSVLSYYCLNGKRENQNATDPKNSTAVLYWASIVFLNKFKCL